MKVVKVSTAAAALSDPLSPYWSSAAKERLSMMPTPLAMVDEVSPFLAISNDHGSVEEAEVAALHDGRTLTLRISWAMPKAADKIDDLDRFVDAAAVIFPLARNASAMTMGAKGQPTNAWYWKAGKAHPYDVIAEGFGSSQRHDGATSGLSARAIHADGRWHVVFQRSLETSRDRVRFVPGKKTGIAFAIWDGRNRERSGRKSFSGEFIPLEIAG